MANTVLVNVADLLQRWTADRLLSTVPLCTSFTVFATSSKRIDATYCYTFIDA